MKRIFALLSILALASAGLSAQTITASPTAPVAAITWTDAAAAAAVALDPTTGVQTAGPGYATVWICTAAATSTSTCPTGTWAAVSGGTANGCPATLASGAFCSIAQTAAAAAFYMPVAYNTTYSMFIEFTWTGSNGGAPSSPSAIFQIATGAAPQVSPAAPAAPAVTIKTSGTYTN
jgi:hypothetical protein